MNTEDSIARISEKSTKNAARRRDSIHAPEKSLPSPAPSEPGKASLCGGGRRRGGLRTKRRQAPGPSAGSAFRGDGLCEGRRGLQVLVVGPALVDALEFAPAVEFPLVHRDAALVRLGLDLLPGKAVYWLYFPDIYTIKRGVLQSVFQGEEARFAASCQFLRRPCRFRPFPACPRSPKAIRDSIPLGRPRPRRSSGCPHR